MITSNGRLNFLSYHAQAENFYRDLLNIFFQLSLKNMNEGDQNAPAIDLIDRENKVVVQVSATCTKQKIESTLVKEVLAIYTADDFHLQFVCIGTQNENIKNGTFSNHHAIPFDPQTDIM